MEKVWGEIVESVNNILRKIIHLFIRISSFILLLTLYVISLPVVLLGEALLRSKVHEEVPNFGISNPIKEFRDDLMDIMSRKHTPTNRKKNRSTLKAEVTYEYERAKVRTEIGEAAFSFWGSIVAVCMATFGFWPYVGTVLSLFVLVITVSIIVRILILEFLAFDETDVQKEHNKTKLELMGSWNRSILNSFSSQISIIFLAMLGLLTGNYYDIARKLMESKFQ